jgi:phosphoribosylglycinamide formyltransferase-1
MTDATLTPPAARASLAILISGRGSNMQAIAKACRNGEIDASVDLVISNRPNAAGLLAAQEFGIETCVIDHRKFASRQDFDHALHECLLAARPDWIVLAGFMRILTDDFVDLWHGRILNIHPSLLPRYPGLNTHARAIAAGDTFAGASVHFVSADLDAGPVIAQVQVPILPDDTPETLSQRVLAKEHLLYINALQHCISSDSKSTLYTVSG